jgi:hypothetical protein
VLGAVALAAVPPAPAEAPKAGGKIRVLILDGQNNHAWRSTTPLMKRELESCGRFTVDVATARQRGTPGDREAMEKFHPDLTKYDAVTLLLG